MLFNSYIFVLLFFPLILFLYFRIYLGKYNRSVEVSKIILIFFSILFYLYAGVQNFIVFTALCVGNVLFYYLLHRTDSCVAYVRRGILWLGVLGNLGVLFYYKYYNFFIDNINALFKTEFQINEINMPLGLSFITFQNIAFLVDAYRRDIVKCSVADYMFYMTYFPKVSSGPITRFQDLIQMKTEENREEFWNNVASGFYLFVMGLGKKVLIADTLLKVTDAGYQHVSELNATTALLVSLAYTFQIYFDFSGYSDMAIGISRMLQINLADNFNSPYKAKSIEEFWDRWHISLTKFLTRYLYIPLGGNRKGKKRTYLNILVVFLCSGLWHGASWTFVIWGGMHGIAMMLSKRFRNALTRIPKTICQIITFLFINFTWIVFRAGDFHTLRGMCQALLRGGWGGVLPEVGSAIRLEWVEKLFDVYVPDGAYIISFLVVLGILVFVCPNAGEKAARRQFTVRNAVWVLMVFIICLLSFSHVTSYIYTRF